MKEGELIRELNARGIYEGETKKERGKYEILSFEPLHDVGKHIENLLTELPYHLPEKEASAIKDIIHCRIGSKYTKRRFDYRCAFVTLAAKALTAVFSIPIQQLLNTLVEIQRLSYSTEA